MSEPTTLKHCERCECSLDIGDAHPERPKLCYSCGEILNGVDPWYACLAAANRKEDAIKALAAPTPVRTPDV